MSPYFRRFAGSIQRCRVAACSVFLSLSLYRCNTRIQYACMLRVSARFVCIYGVSNACLSRRVYISRRSVHPDSIVCVRLCEMCIHVSESFPPPPSQTRKSHTTVLKASACYVIHLPTIPVETPIKHTITL